MRTVLLIIAAAAIAAGTAFGQTTQDPAVQEMKAKLEVVYDLGRMFGYVQTMDKEQKKLALSAAQAKALVGMAEKVLKIVRFEPKEAEAMLIEIEDKILKPDQLMFVDGLAIARASERTATSGSGAGSTGGTSPVQAYMNGGAFNPMKDATKKIGQDFKAAVDYLKAKK
jgi:hypothetical protein